MRCMPHAARGLALLAHDQTAGPARATRHAANNTALPRRRSPEEALDVAFCSFHDAASSLSAAAGCAACVPCM